MKITMRRTGVSAVGAVAAATLLLSGCHASVHVGSTPKVSADTLANTVSKQLAETTGKAAPDITCPDDLTGKVGAKTRCTLTADDGSTIGVSVTVTSVKGTDVRFHIAVDQSGTSTPSDG